VNTIVSPTTPQLPETLGLRTGAGEFGATGAENATVIGEAPSTPVILLAGLIDDTCIGPDAVGALPKPEAGGCVVFAVDVCVAA
jgi:hypothetical protein